MGWDQIAFLQCGLLWRAFDQPYHQLSATAIQKPTFQQLPMATGYLWLLTTSPATIFLPASTAPLPSSAAIMAISVTRPAPLLCHGIDIISTKRSKQLDLRHTLTPKYRPTP